MPSGQEDLFKQVKAAVKEPFEVTGLIGQGGMASVFRAFDPPRNRDVAIKVLRPELTQAMEADRFLREIEITGQLQHPHIVSLFDSGSANGLLYYVMPFVEGESLRQTIAREGKLPIDRAVQVVREVLGAVAYAHARGTIHRDIKPENILISSGLAVLADFGIARAVQHTADEEVMTERGIVVGTPEYMSPEQCTGDAIIDTRSDIYSIGCVLYELLAGEPPFIGRTQQAIAAKHLGAVPTPLRIMRPKTPTRLARVVERSLAKEPADRYQSAQEMLRALEAAVAERRGVPVVAVVVAALAVVATGVWNFFGGSDPVLDANKVAVFPLEERGLAVPERGAGGNVAIMIGTALEHADPLRPLDVRDRLTVSQRDGSATILPSERRTIARDVRAAFYITGFVQAHGDSITVGIRLYDTVGDSLVDQRSASATRASPMHHLGIDAVKEILPALVDPGRRIDLTPLRDRNASAMALFIQGERAYRNSQFAVALDFFHRAIDADSSMAIAGIKAALAANWIEHNVSSDLAAFAADRDSLLPPRYAAFARGLAAFTRGRADSAETWLVSAFEAAPQWPEAAMQPGELYYHLVPNVVSLDSLSDAMYRAGVSYDTTFTPPMFHLAESALRTGRMSEANDWIERFSATAPVGQLVDHLRLMAACVDTGSSDFDWIPQVILLPDVVLRSSKALAAGGYRLGCAESGFRGLLAAGPDDSKLRWGAILGLQSVLAAQGRSSEVVALIDSVVDAGGALSVAMTAYIVDVMAGLPLEQQALELVEFGQRNWGEMYEGLTLARSRDWLMWLFGVWHARTGEVDVVEALLHDLRTANENDYRASTDLYARALEAHARLAAHDTTTAIRLLTLLTPNVPSDSLEWVMGLPLAVERLKLGELLFERGEYARALDVLSVFDHQGPIIYVAFLPASLSLRNRAAAALGRRSEAARFRARLNALVTTPVAGRSP